MWLRKCLCIDHIDIERIHSLHLLYAIVAVLGVTLSANKR